MYDVLVYKMLWDRKKILNINLWRIIRLSMRLATGLCPHISLERILVYTVLVYREFTVVMCQPSYHGHQTWGEQESILKINFMLGTINGHEYFFCMGGRLRSKVQ
jgi:hypothetical protein